MFDAFDEMVDKSDDDGERWSPRPPKVRPLRLAVDVADPRLADRLSQILDGVDGLELVGYDETADVKLVGATVRPVAATRRSTVAPDDIELTPRELEVVTLLAEGASNKVIARRLGISVHTAKFHVGSLIEKLDAVGRTDAVTHAARRGVINL